MRFPNSYSCFFFFENIQFVCCLRFEHEIWLNRTYGTGPSKSSLRFEELLELDLWSSSRFKQSVHWTGRNRTAASLLMRVFERYKQSVSPRRLNSTLCWYSREFKGLLCDLLCEVWIIAMECGAMSHRRHKDTENLYENLWCLHLWSFLSFLPFLSVKLTDSLPFSERSVSQNLPYLVVYHSLHHIIHYLLYTTALPTFIDAFFVPLFNWEPTIENEWPVNYFPSWVRYQTQIQSALGLVEHPPFILLHLIQEPFACLDDIWAFMTIMVYPFLYILTSIIRFLPVNGCALADGTLLLG